MRFLREKISVRIQLRPADRGMGKGRAIQRLGGGDIPAPSEWSSLPGQAVVTGTYTGTVER